MMAWRWFFLLQRVGRTFGIALPLLPRAMREPMVLGYLLARSSDTLADEGGADISQRMNWLMLCSSLVQRLLKEQSWHDLKKEIALMLRDAYRSHASLTAESSETRPQLNKKKSEQELLLRFPHIIEAIKQLPAAVQTILWELWAEILQGQQADLLIRQGGRRVTPQEREAYLYHVAGSVGRAWTKMARVCVDHPLKYPFSRDVPLSRIEAWGIAYGKGLQLINILRDREADLARGYDYYREEECLCLLQQAREYLQQGECYCEAISIAALQRATLLPLRLAQKMLPLLELHQTRGGSSPAKISHWQLYQVVLQLFLENTFSLK